MNRVTAADKAWLAVFALWFALLSGVFARWIGESSPGALQALRLNSMLESRNDQLTALQSELTLLQSQADRLEKSKVTQVREIRGVLGYVAEDEIVFDFRTPDAL